MHHKYRYLIPILLGGLVLVSAALLWSPQEASAQCGSQASSCKNCHEVQGKDPVNNDGTDWHESHAFGDFCYICHGGNNQSMNEDEAHAGMVSPLSDVQAACQGCHPDDAMKKAEVYASTLGVQVSSGGGSTPSSGSGGSSGASGGNTGPSGGTDTTGEASGGSAPGGGQDTFSASSVEVDQSNVIDYTQRYNQTVLGQRQINWGNVIVGLMIAAMALGGGAFIYYNERKRRGLPFLPASLQTPSQAPPTDIPQVEGYSPEVLELLPEIAKLNPLGLHALKDLLHNPEEASELLHSLSRLDPELVRRVRKLDRESKNLLLAMAGD
jgi:hypothetical protein